MVNLRNCTFVFLVFLTCSLNATPDTEWLIHKTEDGAHPSAKEQQMMWLMNRARTNPIEEGKWLVGDTLPLPTNVSGEYAARGISDQLVKDEFKAIPPQIPGAFNRLLYEASKGHSEFMIADNRQSHDG